MTIILRNSKNAAVEKKINNSYLINLAQIPILQKASNAADDDDRDEQIFKPECFKVFQDDRLQRYIVAAEVKIKCDIHTALCHLAAKGYSMKKALVTIESPESLPLKFIQSKNGVGIWSNNEMQTFVQRMKYKRLYKRWNELRRYLPNKSIANLINTYYTLKGIKFSFSTQKFTPVSKRLELQTRIIGFEDVDPGDCENCVKKLWRHESRQEEKRKTKLCVLCKLYESLYGKQRPNARISDAKI